MVQKNQISYVNLERKNVKSEAENYTKNTPGGVRKKDRSVDGGSGQYCSSVPRRRSLVNLRNHLKSGSNNFKLKKMAQQLIGTSKAGFRNLLQIFDLPVSDISVPYSTYLTFTSSTNLSGSHNPVQFHVPPSQNTYFDLFNSYLYVRVSNGISLGQ